MCRSIEEKLAKETVKYWIDGMRLPYFYRQTAKVFVDGCDNPMELLAVMAAVSLQMPL